MHAAPVAAASIATTRREGNDTRNLILALGMVLLISAFSGYIAVRKVLKIDPYDIFRG